MKHVITLGGIADVVMLISVACFAIGAMIDGNKTFAVQCFTLYGVWCCSMSLVEVIKILKELVK